MRRSGKTFRLFQEMSRLLDAGTDRRRILYLNLEDDRLGPIGPGVLSQALETFYRLSPEARASEGFLFLDEIQRVEGWARFARRVLDTESARLVVTGSSSKLLSTEVSTEFRGRGHATEVLPFSFREAVRHAGGEPPDELPGPRARSRLEFQLDRYLAVGGLPEVQDYEEPARMQTLQDYVELVLLRDIVQRHEISNVTAVRSVALAALGSTASRFSVHKTHRDFRSRGIAVAKDTLYSVMGHFEDAFLLFQVPVFRVSLRARQATPRKVYAVDPGLALAVSHVTAESLGARLETAVYLELRRRVRGRRAGAVSYYVTRSGREVDFVLGDVDEGRATELIQVSASLESTETRRRELGALEEAMAECGIESGTVVTLRESEEVMTPRGPILLVPAWRWLLGI
jgi:predicted AAA+ superfamily ATPase